MGKRIPRHPVADRLFKDIPELLRDNRPAGFEAIRDRLLERWEEMASIMTPYNLLKLVLETDRHAMFAEVAMDKVRTKEDKAAYVEFQKFLHGEIELPNTPDEPVASLGSIPTPDIEGTEDDGEDEDEAELDEQRDSEAPVADSGAR